VVGDGLRALVVGDGLTVENDGIATTNLTVTGTLNNRSVSDILPTYTKYIALISQSSTCSTYSRRARKYYRSYNLD
jgi:hypothetical protein